ncbi:hypothetical protein FrEUN1fDRAFT_4594 [Parafrankia sp. EUN1f]|nr:hypothetical protein FrEUN1fDRAFT_4594 [Parafrankia sp. EUN1f]
MSSRDWAAGRPGGPAPPGMGVHRAARAWTGRPAFGRRSDDSYTDDSYTADSYGVVFCCSSAGWPPVSRPAEAAGATVVAVSRGLSARLIPPRQNSQR